MAKQEFYLCPICGKIIAYVNGPKTPVMCCGEKMQEIIPNSVDASVEKHVPVINIEGNIVKVTVGNVEHPMLDEHHIVWISMESKKGNQRKELLPGEKPEAVFALTENDIPVTVYAYCNLHGLWKKGV